MKKLTPGMHIHVLSPSDSVESIGKFEANLTAKKRLESLGFQVSFSEHYLEHDLLGSASIQSRVATCTQLLRMMLWMSFWQPLAAPTPTSSCPIWIMT